MTSPVCFRRILLLSILTLSAACGVQKDRRLPGGPWDVEAQDRADERGVADGVLSFDRSRISVPTSYSHCLQMSPPLSFVSCWPAYTEVLDGPRRSIDLAQRFSTKAQLTEVGLWPIRPDEVLDQDFREFAQWYVKPPVIAPKRLEYSRVAQEALPLGADACIRFYLRGILSPLFTVEEYYQKSGLFCMKRTQDPPGLLTVAGVVSESADPARGQRLSPGFDEASEPVLRTLEFVDGKEPDKFGSRWFEANPPSRASSRPR